MAKTKKAANAKKAKRDRKSLNLALAKFQKKTKRPQEPYDESNPEHEKYIGRDQRKNEDNNFMGRPTVMTEQSLLKLHQAFSIGCTDKEACIYAGIHESTLYRYCKKNPDFSEEKEELKDKIVLTARAVMVRHLNNNSESMAMVVLRSKRKLEWSDARLVVDEGGVTLKQLEAMNRGDYEVIDEDETKDINGGKK